MGKELSVGDRLAKSKQWVYLSLLSHLVQIATGLKGPWSPPIAASTKVCTPQSDLL